MDMTELEIKMAMLRHGVKKNDIAKQCKVSSVSLSYLVAGKMVSHRLQSALAEAIKMTPDQIWPSRYDLDGQPLRTRPRRAA